MQLHSNQSTTYQPVTRRRQGVIIFAGEIIETFDCVLRKHRPLLAHMLFYYTYLQPNNEYYLRANVRPDFCRLSPAKVTSTRIYSTRSLQYPALRMHPFSTRRVAWRVTEPSDLKHSYMRKCINAVRRWIAGEVSSDEISTCGYNCIRTGLMFIEGNVFASSRASRETPNAPSIMRAASVYLVKEQPEPQRHF